MEPGGRQPTPHSRSASHARALVHCIPEVVTEARAGLIPGKQITKGVSLLEPLGSGGMGAVWLADHQGLKTRVVVKFMLLGLDSSDSARTRFSREAAAAAQVKSPHVVQMLDHGLTDDGIPFIVMEHLEGHDLGDEIEAHGALDPAKVVTVVTQIGKALSKVHAAGLLHRDIKPDNIFLVDGEDETFVKLLDFGIAKSANVDHGDGSLDGETKTGQIVGTPFYMSPEQVTAQKVIDHRSDLWALGVVAFEALTGQRPFDGPSFGALAVKIATGAPPKPTEVNPSLPPSVDLWFAKACAREPAARFASAKEMTEAFRAAFDGVVSLPASAINSDSGQRSRLSSSSGSGSGSGPRDAKIDTGSGSGPRAASPTFGLAATALPDNDSGAKAHVALGRSEAGMSVADDATSKQRSSPLLFIGGAVVLTIVVAAVFIWSAKSNPSLNANNNQGSTNGAVSGSGNGTTSSATMSTSAGVPTITITSVGTTPSTQTSAALPVHDAAAVTSNPVVHVPTGRPSHPNGNGNGGNTTPPKPTESVPPKPTAKPTSSEPDLF